MRLSGRKHDAKTRSPTHHSIECFGRSFESEFFDHGLDARLRAERQSVLGIDRSPGRPSLDGASATDQVRGRYLHGFLRNPDDDHFPVDAKTAD
jgi:hypothetical protein